LSHCDYRSASGVDDQILAIGGGLRPVLVAQPVADADEA
jgi:hypothetical protein